MSLTKIGHKKIAIASDHAGFELKRTLRQKMISDGFDVVDLGTQDANISVDYPDYGYAVAKLIAAEEVELGVIICGSGIGITIAANRNPKVRAALCTNIEMAKLAREHNDANVLALGARIIDQQTAIDCLKTFLQTKFMGGRHESRVKKLSNPVEFE